MQHCDRVQEYALHKFYHSARRFLRPKKRTTLPAVLDAIHFARQRGITSEQIGVAVEIAISEVAATNPAFAAALRSAACCRYSG